MSEIAGNLPREFIGFRFFLGFASSAHKLPEERDSKNYQLAQIGEVNTVVVGETSTSAPKDMSILPGVPMRAESIGVTLEVANRDLPMAEKDFDHYR